MTTAVVDGDPHRLKLAEPEGFMVPPDGLNIRLNDTPQLQEARLHDYKRFAAQAFARSAPAARARAKAHASPESKFAGAAPPGTRAASERSA